MIDDTLDINPTMRIFHAGGLFVAGWQPMDKMSIVLNESDFVLLSIIGDPDHQSKIIRKFRTKLRTYFLQNCSRLQAEHRINELKKAKIILSAHSDTQNIPVTPVPIELNKFNSGPATKLSFYNQRLRLSHNFMLQPVQTGFQIWSSISRSYHTLSLDMILIVIFFSSGKTINKYITEKKQPNDNLNIPRAIKWLHNNGLLVSIKEKSTHPKEPIISDTHEQTISNEAITSNHPLSLNDRIPIYFVPHMPNHYPLALGMMYSFIENYNDGVLLEKCMLVPIVYLETSKDILAGPYHKYGQGIWLFSNYMWSIVSNLEISAAVKNHNQHNITIHGGPSTPSYEIACSNFMMERKSVDIAVHGEGEFTIVELIDALSSTQNAFDRLNIVKGITFRNRITDADGIENETLIRTEPRARIKDLDVLPSPYLTGVFDAYGGSIAAAIIESNRGCPFGCTFCDWGSATNQKIRKFELQRVKNEIEWIGKNKIQVIWVADANFGIFERDIEITEWICHVKDKYGYPKEVVVNYTKNATKRLTKIVELFAENNICSQGIISIQTRDEITLEVINRKNIKTDKYNDLAEIFRIEGLPLSTDLMIGLPGMTVESFKEDLQYFFDMDITVKAYQTELLPNSPMADPDYIKKYKIEVDENNFLSSTFSYSRDELHEVNVLYYLFTIADSFSILRYVLRYLRWDHGILPLNFIHKLHNEIQNDPYRYPTITYMSKVFQYYMSVPGGWHQFYNEVADFTQTMFGVKRNSGFNTVLHFNEMVMPDDALSYPLNVQLEHDFLTYFMEHNLKPTQNKKLLITYPPAATIIDDKYFYGHINYNNEQYDSHQVFWELQSPVARIQSIPNFM